MHSLPRTGKLGIFDSGLGGLLMARAIQNHLPDLDIAYLGDTLHVPYGKRSSRAVYNFTKAGISFLFEQAGCELIILACNTACGAALRPLQQIYLPKQAKDRPHQRILGVVVPMLEHIIAQDFKRIGILGTPGTVDGNIYGRELAELAPGIEIYQNAAPLLVPLIEDGGYQYVRPILRDYMAPLMGQDVEAIILGCTHYPYLKDMAADIAGPGIQILSQDDIVPAKLEEYLAKHSKIAQNISCSGARDFYLTDVTEAYLRTAGKLFGGEVDFQSVELTYPSHENDDYVPDLKRLEKMGRGE